MLSILIMHACSDGSHKKDAAADGQSREVIYAGAKQKGTEVAMQAQATLLANVGAAIKKGGTAYAVEFCNIEASGLVDSLNAVYDCKISRVTNRRRNPKNGITGDNDK